MIFRKALTTGLAALLAAISVLPPAFAGPGGAGSCGLQVGSSKAVGQVNSVSEASAVQETVSVSALPSGFEEEDEACSSRCCCTGAPVCHCGDMGAGGGPLPTPAPDDVADGRSDGTLRVCDCEQERPAPPATPPTEPHRVDKPDVDRRWMSLTRSFEASAERSHRGGIVSTTRAGTARRLAALSVFRL